VNGDPAGNEQVRPIRRTPAATLSRRLRIVSPTRGERPEPASSFAPSYFFAAFFALGKSDRYCPYPSCASFSAGMKRSAAEFMQ
jgi:hypothetical protein